MMEHTNLFLFENKAALDAAYPDGEVTTVPGVAYARASGNEGYTVLFNKKITNYTVTLQLQDKSGATVGTSVTAQTPNVLDGETIKYKVVAPEIENYKPRNKEEKIEISGDTSFTVIYLGLTDYTVTVHHVFSGSPITADTQVVVEDVWDESPVKVTIEPVSVSGYKAEPVTITVSGNCEYNLEYEELAYEAIDLDLPSGTKWANMNVGASSPEDFGGYYAWGEIEEKDTYSYATYRFFNSSDSSYTKYNSADGKFVLDQEDDVACVKMGGDWHMPTFSQMKELLENTTSAITVLNGVSGVTLTSTENGNSIFLPFSGIKDDEGKPIPEDANFLGLYTSNGMDGTCGALSVGYYQGSGFVRVDTGLRTPGISVRGVIGEDPEPEPGPAEY